MQFSTVFAIVASAFIASAAALPVAGGESSQGPPPSSGKVTGSNQCGQQQAEACCNSPNGDAVAAAECAVGARKLSMSSTFVLVLTM